jgi:ABC-type multidrug transport system ATPase subunit
MGNPSLVLLDEPSEGLSPKIVEQMVGAILTMKKEGVSIVVSEQNLHFARLISDRAYIIERGRICFGGTMANSTRVRTSATRIWRCEAAATKKGRGTQMAGVFRPKRSVKPRGRPTCSTSRSASSCARSGSATPRSSPARSAST